MSDNVTHVDFPARANDGSSLKPRDASPPVPITPSTQEELAGRDKLLKAIRCHSPLWRENKPMEALFERIADGRLDQAETIWHMRGVVPPNTDVDAQFVDFDAVREMNPKNEPKSKKNLITRVCPLFCHKALIHGV